MRLCHETNKGLDLCSPQKSQRSVNLDHTGCHPLAMDTNRPSFPGGFREEVRRTWAWQGTEEFLGLIGARGRVSTPQRGKSQCLDPEG
jgi:hypothetical protein